MGRLADNTNKVNNVQSLVFIKKSTADRNATVTAGLATQSETQV